MERWSPRSEEVRTGIVLCWLLQLYYQLKLRLVVHFHVHLHVYNVFEFVLNLNAWI